MGSFHCPTRHNVTSPVRPSQLTSRWLKSSRSKLWQPSEDTDEFMTTIEIHDKLYDNKLIKKKSNMKKKHGMHIKNLLTSFRWCYMSKTPHNSHEVLISVMASLITSNWTFCSTACSAKRKGNIKGVYNQHLWGNSTQWFLFRQSHK